MKIAKNNSEIDIYKYEINTLINIMEGKKDIVEQRLKEIESLLEEMGKKISDFNLINNEIKKYEIDIKNIKEKNELQEKKIKQLNNKLKELEKNISELESTYKFNKEQSVKESIKKKKFNIEETCMKNKKINETEIEDELNKIFMSLKGNASLLRSKLLLKKLDPLINKNCTSNPYILFNEINTKIFFLDEYNEFTNIYLKLYELNKRIKNIFNDNSFKIYDIYNNFINFEPKRTGNILLNFNYYNDEVKVEFYNNIKKNEKICNKCETGKEINIIDFYKINELNIDEAIEKVLEETKSYDYKKDCPNLQFGTGRNLKNEEQFFQMLDEYFSILYKLNDIFKAFEEDKTNNSIEGIKRIIVDIK
jgi:hypothetical protein